MKPKFYNTDFFGSYEEQETYCRCVSKAELGDIVDIYVKPSYDHMHTMVPSNHRTDFVREVKIIGIGQHNNINCGSLKKCFLLGAHSSEFSFWNLCVDNIKIYAYNIKDIMPNYSGYSYGWSVQSFSDANFARIKK